MRAGKERAAGCIAKLRHLHLGRAWTAWRERHAHDALLKQRLAPLLVRWRMRLLAAAFQSLREQVCTNFGRWR